MVIDCRNGPVYERAICIYACIPEDQFLEGLEVWKEAVSSEFPVYTRFADQEITLSRDGAQPPVQKISIRHRFWSADPQQEHADWCIQLAPDRFIVNLRREGSEDRKGFAVLREFFGKWHIQWMSCFGSPALKHVKLEYWNRINKDTVPGHAIDNYVEVKDIFTVFAETPMPQSATKYVVPYQYQANWETADTPKPFRLSAGIKALSSKPMTLQAHFQAGIDLLETEAPGDKLDRLHRLLLEVFDAFFTSEAKELFK